MGATILSRRRFNEALLATLPVSPSEMESLSGLAAEEGAGFPRLLVSRGLLTPEGLLRAYQALCGIPAFRRDPDADPPAPADASSDLLPARQAPDPGIRRRRHAHGGDGGSSRRGSEGSGGQGHREARRGDGRNRGGDPRGDREGVRRGGLLDGAPRGAGRGRCAGSRRRRAGGAADRRRLRGAHHPAGELRHGARDRARRERHPLRAVREGAARPVPDRRHPRGRGIPPAAAPDRDPLPHQDHGAAEHRGEPASAGRPREAPDRREGDRFPRLDDPHAVRGERRDPHPRPGGRPAEHGDAGLLPRHAVDLPADDLRAVRDDPRHRPHRQREDDHALRRPAGDRVSRAEDHHHRGPGGVPDPRASSRSR